MRKTGVILSVLLLLSGCGQYSNEYEKREKEVEEYNKLVTDTLFAYATIKENAKLRQEEIEDFIFSNKPIREVGVLDSFELLTENEKYLFEYRSIISNDFYTSLGASLIRQVIVVKGKGSSIMTVEILWNDTGIDSITRRIL